MPQRPEYRSPPLAPSYDADPAIGDTRLGYAGSTQVAGNASIELVASTGEISISCAVESEHPGHAVQPASDNIFLALHQAQIATTDWPTVDDPHWRVEFIASRAEALAAPSL